MKIPFEVRKVLTTLEEKGYEGFVVGGAIRNEMLGLTPKDYDVCTNAPHNQLEAIFKDFKLFQTGLKSGTVTVILNSVHIEVTTYRAKSLEEDLIRRDFTVNSICYNRDYFAHPISFEDLEKRLIRVWDYDKSFIDDPLRILRAIRLCYSYSFTIEEKTRESMFKYKHLLSKVAYERIHDEFCKILLTDGASKAIEEYFEIFLQFIPELEAMKGLSQDNPYHIYDVLTHTLVALENSAKDLEIRVALLFHDIAKPLTHSVVDGVAHFYGHPEKGVEIANEILNRLKFSNENKQNIKKLIMYHDYVIECKRKSVRKILNKVEGNFDKLLEVKRCDILAQNPKYIDRLNTLKEIENIAKDIIQELEGYSLKTLAITGREVLDLGYEGKEIGDVLNDVLTLVIDGELENDHDKLLEYVKSIDERNKS